MIPAKLVQKSMQIHLANKLLQKYPVKACIVNGVHKKILADRNYALPLGQITHVFGLWMPQDNLHYANGIPLETIVKMLLIKTLNN